jgi:hypothetical protein
MSTLATLVRNVVAATAELWQTFVKRVVAVLLLLDKNQFPALLIAAIWVESRPALRPD